MLNFSGEITSFTLSTTFHFCNRKISYFVQIGRKNNNISIAVLMDYINIIKIDLNFYNGLVVIFLNIVPLLRSAEFTKVVVVTLLPFYFETYSIFQRRIFWRMLCQKKTQFGYIFSFRFFGYPNILQFFHLNCVLKGSSGGIPMYDNSPSVFWWFSSFRFVH